MRVFNITGTGVVETDVLPPALPDTGYVWLACALREFEASLPAFKLHCRPCAAPRSSTCTSRTC